jgi:hypothetical protein
MDICITNKISRESKNNFVNNYIGLQYLIKIFITPEYLIW